MTASWMLHLPACLLHSECGGKTVRLCGRRQTPCQAATAVVGADLTSQKHGHVGIVPAAGTLLSVWAGHSFAIHFCEQLSCCSAACSVLNPAAVDAHMQQAALTAAQQTPTHHPVLPAGMHHSWVPASVVHL